MSTDAVRALARLSRVLERASDELPLAHYRVLAAVASGEARATRVAQRLAVGKPAVSAAVDALCQRELLVKQPVAEDQRATTLVVTRSGQATLARIERAMGERVDLLLCRTPDATQTVQSLVWLADAMDTLAAERHP